MSYFKRLGLFLAAIFGVAKTEDALDVAIDKLITPDVKAHLIDVISGLFNTKTEGKDRKAQAKASLEAAKQQIKENAAKAGEEALSRAIELIVNREKLKGVVDARKENSSDHF